jgi:hypothetical protein
MLCCVCLGWWGGGSESDDLKSMLSLLFMECKAAELVPGSR